MLCKKSCPDCDRILRTGIAYVPSGPTNPYQRKITHHLCQKELIGFMDCGIEYKINDKVMIQ